MKAMQGYSYIPNPYFKEEKLACTHTGIYYFDEEFLADLIEIRKTLDFGLIISSAYPSERQNHKKASSGKKAAWCAFFGQCSWK